MSGAPPTVVLSYGLGVDSSAILARWLTDPTSRDFPLENLAVVTAMTGDEWEETGRLVEAHMLPLMAREGVRYLQVARRGPLESAGVTVLDDSRRPGTLQLAGEYTLADELLAAGTVPQVAGSRKCSAHSKGFPLDTVIARITQGRPYRHVVGFEAGELSRARRDAGYNTATRTGEYPLIDWGWDRARCETFLTDVFPGVKWIKSACSYCPFALVTASGKERVVTQYLTEPAAGARALLMEFTATALNPAQGLLKNERLLDLLRSTPGTEEVLARFTAQLAAEPWALYDVRRALAPRRDGGVNHSRSLQTLARGDQPEMLEALEKYSHTEGAPVVVGCPQYPADRHPRVWLRRRAPVAPTAERFLAIAPATAADKIGPAFARAWAAADQLALAF